MTYIIKGFLFFMLMISFQFLLAQQAKKAVFVIVDGIPADVIEKVPTPTLDSIAAQGGYARASVGGEKGGYSQTPTISAVGYNSLLTGTWVNKHNVWGNDIKAPNYNYYTIFRLFKEQYPQKKAAIFSTWEDNRTRLIGEGLAETGKLKLDYHFDGLEHDTLRFPHDGESNYIHEIDEAVTDTAAEHIKQEGPDLSWIYLQYTDDMGHKFGDSRRFYDAVEIMDDQMNRIWNAIQYRKNNFREDWVIYITTDHGRDSATGKGHGGQSARERSTWIVTNDNVNDYFKSGKAAIVDIMPSLANVLNIKIPEEQLREIDGVPLNQPLSATDLTVSAGDGTLAVTWKPLQKKGKAKVWVSSTNDFKAGGKDNWVLKATVALKNGHAKVDVSDMPSQFYKVVLETPANLLNRQVTVQ